MWEKLGGLGTIVVAVAALCLISVYDPPTFVQILCALIGSVVCLFGVVFLFAEGSILEGRRARKASKAG
ncbi:MAG: hypothetical protein ACYDAA_10665 [Syntrophales bacterium]